MNAELWSRMKGCFKFSQDGNVPGPKNRFLEKFSYDNLQLALPET